LAEDGGFHPGVSPMVRRHDEHRVYFNNIIVELVDEEPVCFKNFSRKFPVQEFN
jgi:hypothetical protein